MYHTYMYESCIYIYVYIQPFSPSIFQRPTSWARQNHQNPKPTTGISHELGTMLWNCHTSGAEFPSRCLLMASLLKEFGGWVGWSGSQSFLWQQTKNGKKTYVSTNVQVKWTLDHMCIYIYIYTDANHLATGSKYPSLPWWSFSGRLEAEKVLLHHLL